MTPWPRSLVGRNALLIVALIVLAEVGSAALIRRLVIVPRVGQIADSVARNVAAVRAGLAAVPAADRQAFIDAFRRHGERGGDASAGSGGAASAGTASRGAEAADDTDAASQSPPASLSPLERAFMRAVTARLAADDTDVVWRRDADHSLALRLRIEGEVYWLPLPDVLPPRELASAWLAASATAALLALFGALAIQRRIARPLRALVGATATLGRGSRPEPLPEEGPSEIATVSRSFNQLVQRLAEADRERSLMLAGVSHDLRTPLTKLRLGVEILGDGIEPELAASMNRSIAEMDGIVGQFLDFARFDEAGAPRQRLALDALARDAAAAAADHGRTVTLEAAPVPAVEMQAERVGRAIANLIENAFRHGAAPVVVRTGHDATSAWIEVVDAGPGIAAAEVEAMRQPFRRAGSARAGSPGAGLGLAIVERVARAHGGALELLPASPHGLCARLRLPLPAAA